MKPSDFGHVPFQTPHYAFSLPDIGIDYTSVRPDPSFFAPQICGGSDGPPIRDAERYWRTFGPLPPTKGRTVVDLCSGIGNLDDMFSDALRLLRVDPLYAQKKYRRRVESGSGLEGRQELYPTSVFATGLPNNVADLVLEHFGVHQYLDEVLLGNGHVECGDNISIFFPRGTSGADDEEINHTLRYARSRLARGILTYVAALEEMLRITKPGGHIFAGPNVNDAVTRTFIMPIMRGLSAQGVACLDVDGLFGRTFVIKKE